ncbi:histidine phosphatase family protein, partial [Rhizobiaceae bacterium]|nr:histidine phosphatase family protein [Rhizobiaceae bacterium]
MDHDAALPYGTAMFRLSILRHAKSSWATPGMADIDRPLNERGRQQADALRDWLKTSAFECDAVLCSQATRTRETLTRIEASLPDAERSFPPRLYAGHGQDYLDALAGLSYRNVLIVGHNPTCDELVRALSSNGGPHAQRLSQRHYGTANFATVAFEVAEWTDIREASG